MRLTTLVDELGARARSRTRWLGVGSSSLDDAREAGREATREALESRDASLVVVFASEAFDLPELLGGVNDVAGGAPVVGCTTAGEIASDGPRDASVVVVGLGGKGFSVSTAVFEHAAQDLREAGAQVAASFDAVDGTLPHRALLLLTDGFTGDQQDVVRGAYSVLGSDVPLVGGCAGDDLKMTATHQFYGDRVLTGAVIGAALASSSPLGIGVRHGWRKVGTPMVVTSSEPGAVVLLDGRPALDEYINRLGIPPEVQADEEAFVRFALMHPLALDRRSGEAQVRCISGADFEKRTLHVIADVPQGAITWLMEGDEESVLDASDAACRDALAALDGHEPLGFFAFDCIARRSALGGEGINREVERIVSHAPGVPVAGFYTYGEIARTRGISGFHNQTLVVLAVS